MIPSSTFLFLHHKNEKLYPLIHLHFSSTKIQKKTILTLKSTHQRKLSRKLRWMIASYISLNIEVFFYHFTSVPMVKGIWRTHWHMWWHGVYQVHPRPSLVVDLAFLVGIQGGNWRDSIYRKLIILLCLSFNNFFSWFFYGLFCCGSFLF